MTNHAIIQFLDNNEPNTGNTEIDLDIILNQMCEMGMIDKNPDGTYTPTERGEEIFLESFFGSNNN
jgi:hypothetical protein